MFRKSLVVASFLSVSLFALVSGVYAQSPDLYFYPSGQWKVGQTASKSCIVASELNNGFILNIIGSKDRLDSISIDFRQDALEAKANYDAQLTIPGLEPLMLPGVAVNRQILNIDVRGQDNLFSNMILKSAFDLSLDQNNFRFYLTGFGKALEDADFCGMQQENLMDDIKEAKAPSANAVASYETIEMPSVNKTIIDAQKAAPVAGVAKEVITPAPATKAIVAQNQKQELSELAKAELTTPGFSINELSSQGQPMTTQMLNERFAMSLRGRKDAMVPVQENIPAPAPKQIIELTPPPSMQSPKTELVPTGPQKRLSQQIQEEIDENPTTIAGASVVQKPMQPGTVKPAVAPTSSQSVARESTILSLLEAPEKSTTQIERKAFQNIRSREPKINKIQMSAQSDFTQSYSEGIRGFATADSAKNVASIEPAAGVTSAMQSKEWDKIQKKLRDMRTENIALRQKLDETRKSAELSSVKGMTNDEKRVMMRYSEAERQIERLSLQMQKERAMWEQEKARLENMLFDPRLTEKAQIARLQQLEKELSQTQRELRHYQAMMDQKLKNN